MINVAVIDDHALFRIGLTGILRKDSRIRNIYEYAGFKAVEPLVGSWDVDIAFVDISLGKESGLEAARFIKETNPRTKVVILSGHKEEFYLVNAMEAGVDGYMHKDIDEHELLMGIGKVIAGDKFFSTEISNLIISNMYSRPQKGVPFLTNKEKQVVKYLMDGYSSKEIAAELNVSPRTVETHRANVLSKFELRSTTELVRRIIEQGIRY
jgi:DNA-binding NarL/FixJ family response regulator